MKALRVGDYVSLNSASVENIERHVPGPDEVLVRISAASVNPLDLKLLSGRMSTIFPLSFPYIPGTDLAGTVEAVGALVQHLIPGDRVFGRLDPRKGGAFAEYALLPAHDLSLTPTGVDAAMAACLPTAAGTAWLALFDIGRIRAGQKVLIHAAGGGVGTFAVQLAKRAGACVIATASADNHGLLRRLGADEVIDYRQDDFTRLVADVDMVLDPVGGETQRRSWSVLRAGGILVSLIDRTLGATKGDIRSAFAPLSHNAATLLNLALLLADGKLQAVIDTVYPLDQARQALEHVAGGHAHGKVLVGMTK
ncbi:NADP-dependent oxidoreductase [Acerihabitans arboris]|uniref:Zinc-binding dehydrogenase n=1 Tax=Acerihabitans arboris TaxID=2691583 RepID=A0A845SE70_9GAMM|nr:NADP-dependent oxidoreductase [Acerihabitans arboris]NDL62179.1 zinc-binding dehydrogenase [Acerihabitans arboris]